MSLLDGHLTALENRRSQLRSHLGESQALIPSGQSLGRNYAGNPFPFRASSHFLFLAGKSLENAFFLSCPSGDALFIEPQSNADILWHGKHETLA